MVDHKTTMSDYSTTTLQDHRTEDDASTRRSQWSVVSSQSSSREGGFTLAELLVSIGVLVLLVLLFTQLLNSAANITTLGHKQMGSDSEARQLLDRMAIDFAQMPKRSDVDYFAKGTVAPRSVGGPMTGNDSIAFYSTVPGYYPATGSRSPVSLVAYRVNAQNKLERLGVGLVWNGVVSLTDKPVVFMPLTISATWPSATDLTASPTPEPRAEVIGPQVFRFEYCYLLTNGSVSITPPTDISGIAAIIADIAVIDPKSKVLLTDQNITTIIGKLPDFVSGMTPGELRRQWQDVLDNRNNPDPEITNLPRPAISGIRVYERYFYLNQ
jgi:hypothetical protein